MPRLTGELTHFNTLSGTISVFTGDLSKTQFERIWDQIIERIDSAEIPPITIIDDHLDVESSRPVQNKVITAALDDLYRLFPTVTVDGDPTHRTVTIEDGADGIPLDNLSFDIPPQQNGSGTPSPDNPRTFNHINDIASISCEIYDENNHRINGYQYPLSIDRNDIYAGRIDLKLGKLYKYAYYPNYDEDEVGIIGPWVSSQAAYEAETDPPTGSQVIDFGNIEEEIELGEAATSMLKNLGTRRNKLVYDILGTGDFSFTYRADPKAYTDLATGLTTAQRTALIALLDDDE